ncbi:hypothetical protein J6590_066920 [Homalodisca vitripennis]|nr:hypothetical protein J6590_066920 [Homalodisca vitripennis]
MTNNGLLSEVIRDGQLITVTKAFRMFVNTLSMAIHDVAVTRVGVFIDRISPKELRMSRSRWVRGSVWSKASILKSPGRVWTKAGGGDGEAAGGVTGDGSQVVADNGTSGAAEAMSSFFTQSNRSSASKYLCCGCRCIPWGVNALRWIRLKSSTSVPRCLTHTSSTYKFTRAVSRLIGWFAGRSCR